LIDPLGAGVAVELAESPQDEGSLESHPAPGPAHLACQSLKIVHGNLAAKIRNWSIHDATQEVKHRMQCTGANPSAPRLVP
jgi:hypothetical protein